MMSLLKLKIKREFNYNNRHKVVSHIDKISGGGRWDNCDGIRLGVVTIMGYIIRIWNKDKVKLCIKKYL